jgi:ribosomal protein L29
MNKIKKELKSLDKAQLMEKVVLLRQELFALNLNAATAHIKDYSQFKKLRRSLACALTYLRQKAAAELGFNR